MNTAHTKTLTTTSNAGTVSWQPATEPQDNHHGHDNDEFVFGGYVFGPTRLVKRAIALMGSDRVPGLAGYDVDEQGTRTVSLTHDIDYPLALPGTPRPTHTTPARDIVAALTAAHGDYAVTLGDAAEQVLYDYINDAYPDYFDTDTDDEGDVPDGFVPSEPIY